MTLKKISFRVASIGLSVAALVLMMPAAWAHHTGESHGAKAPGGRSSNLANQATNPAAALIQLRLQNISVPESYDSSGYANTIIVQPVISFARGKDKYFQNLVLRTTTRGAKSL